MFHLINVKNNLLFLLFLVTHLNQILVSVTGVIATKTTTISLSSLVTGTETTAIDNEGCVVPFSSKKYWDVFWPLIFHTDGKLYETTKIVYQDDVSYGKSSSSSVVVVSYGDEIFVSCSPNYIKERIPQTEYVRAICQNDGKFLVKGNTVNISQSLSSSTTTKTIRDLRCDLRAIEEVLETVSDCSTPSTSVNFGYTNPIDKLSYVIGEACYNTQKGQTRFIHIHLTASAATTTTPPPPANKINSNTSSSVSVSDASELRTESKRFFKKSHPQLGYKVEFMKAFRLDEFNDRLKNILNDNDVNDDTNNNINIPSFKIENYIDENLLGNQQYYSMMKLSWNYFIIYDDISINMKLLKKDIKDITDDIDLYIGSHGVIKLKKSISNIEIPIYLIDEKFPIPEILWFIVKNDDKATVLVIFNNPELTLNDITNNKFCNSSSKCNEITWLKRTGKQDVYLNLKHGAIICCNYDEFKKSIEEVPNLKGIKDLYV